ncbi:MAG TPA: hypothetical protein DD624_06365 [Alphaproteobacteria bacterium]|nr:hypothetical protein [Alphaproteobacteria bacterium]
MKKFLLILAVLYLWAATDAVAGCDFERGQSYALDYLDADGNCVSCSNVYVKNATCLYCTHDGSHCGNFNCKDGYVDDLDEDGLARGCAKAAGCQYPLKEATDYSGECDGCCTD